MSGLHKLLVCLVLVMVTAVAIPFALAQPQGGITPRAYLPIAVKSCNAENFDDFSNPDSGWPQLDTAQVTMDYLNGEYRIFSKVAPGVYGAVAPFPGYENYRVEADAHFNAPPTDGLYGLMFGVVTQGTEVTQFYLFTVEPDEQEFRLFRRETDGGYTPLIDSTFSMAIRPSTETNRLTAVRNGEQITLAVNGNTLGTWTDNVITGPTYTGLALSPRSANPQADGRFDNFHVYGCLPGTGATAATFQQATPLTVYDAFDLE
jgi:hypothetical protein